MKPDEQRSEALLSFFDHVATAMSITRLDGTMVKVNRAYCDFLGYSEEELLHMKVLDFTFPGDRDLTLARFQEAEAGNSVLHYEKRYLRKDGRIVWGHVSTFWTREGEAEIPFCVGMVQDITARKEMESALRASEELYRTLVENVTLGINLIGEDRSILKVNQATSRMLDLPEEALLGRKCFRSFENREKVCAHCPGTRSLATGKPATVITEGFRADGGKVVARIQTFPVPDGSGQQRSFVEVVEDITEGVETRDALRESERRFRAIFENAGAGIYTISPEGKFLQVNPALCRFLGYGEEELLALSLEEVTLQEDRDLARHIVQKKPCTPACHWHHETRFLHKDGSVFWAQVSGAWQLDETGAPEYAIGLVQNITERRRAEERTRLDAAALMSTRDAVLITDRAPRILSINPAFTEITGYSEEIIGEHPGILSSDRQDRGSLHQIWAHLQRDGYWQGEMWGCRKDGELFPGWLSVSTVRNEKNRPTHFVGVITDLTRLKKSEEKLQYLANYDALTGLPKRQMFESVLQYAIERGRREHLRTALLLIDLDQFKTINESFGHKVGDQLLIAAVQRLRARVRQKDSLSRMVGDGFALLLEGIEDLADVEVITREIQATLDAPFVLPEGQQVFLRASVGISIFPQDGESAQELLRGAEAAVNLAKERGGDQLCYSTSELNNQARIRLEIQNELRQALERDEFILHYQPKVHLRSGRIVGTEALLRWSHPEKGIIPPNEFIPIAEKSGLIVPLGAWVIENVCRQIRLWLDGGLEDVRVAVNVSARQFRSGQLEKLVLSSLQNHRLDPQRLMIELTESMVMDDPDDAIRRISALRAIGVGISLDDFGTGYSSLCYLSRIPIDQLKIDRSFITDIAFDPNSATISTSVIALAHRMQLKVVAEGVETEAQLGYLRQNDCDEIQGFYFSKPVPPEEFAALSLSGKTLPADDPSDRPTLLIVDDEPEVLTSLRRLLWNEDYRVLTATSGREGLELLARNSVHVIMADQRMPEMNGTEFLRRVRALYPQAVRIILSGHPDLSTLSASVNEAALYKFLVKPWEDEVLQEQIRGAFDHYEASAKHRGVLLAGR